MNNDITKVLVALENALRTITYEDNGNYYIGFYGDADVTEYVKPAIDLLNALTKKKAPPEDEA